MKKIIYLLVIVFTFSIITPSITFAKNNNLGGDNNFEIIYDSENLVIYQIIEADGNVYEYVESVTILNNGDEMLYQEKYLITIKEEKQLLEINKWNITKFLKNVSANMSQNLIDQKILDEQPEHSIFSNSKSGGSYIADVRWIEYSSGTAYAIAGGTKSKSTTTTTWQYRDFKSAANAIVSAEKDIVSLGMIGLVDAVIAAVKGGELLSWTLIKKVAGQLGKAVPIAGTIATIYNYVSLYNKAQDAYNNIP
ncbi:hypothetical protein [Metasolibacillus sp. FSL K6-0083]|uniref:hypothetical protein n=1 Tax=Metasolibacillus sp. FSL K6-0083 TaxID=2921416 RepID=UPI003159BF09